MELLGAVAALSFAGTAQASDKPPRFKPEVERHVAQDGRGDTADFRASRTNVDRPTASKPNEGERPQTLAPRAALPIKSEIAVRLSEEHEKLTVPGADVKKPQPEEKTTLVEKKADPLPIKMEILMRIGGEEIGGEHAANVSGSKLAQPKQAVNNAALLPLLNTAAKMKLQSVGHDGNGDASDER